MELNFTNAVYKLLMCASTKPLCANQLVHKHLYMYTWNLCDSIICLLFKIVVIALSSQHSKTPCDLTIMWLWLFSLLLWCFVMWWDSVCNTCVRYLWQVACNRSAITQCKQIVKHSKTIAHAYSACIHVEYTHVPYYTWLSMYYSVYTLMWLVHAYTWNTHVYPVIHGWACILFSVHINVTSVVLCQLKVLINKSPSHHACMHMEWPGWAQSLELGFSLALSHQLFSVQCWKAGRAWGWGQLLLLYAWEVPGSGNEHVFTQSAYCLSYQHDYHWALLA